MLNDIWAEIPYILVCAWWWIILPCLIIAIPWLWVYKRRGNTYEKYNGIDYLSVSIAVVITGFVILGYVAAVMVYESHHSYDGHHEWRNGAGPNTICHYEERREMVGVVGKGGHYEDHIYTVCIDSVER